MNINKYVIISLFYGNILHVTVSSYTIISGTPIVTMILLSEISQPKTRRDTEQSMHRNLTMKYVSENEKQNNIEKLYQWLVIILLSFIRCYQVAKMFVYIDSEMTRIIQS